MSLNVHNIDVGGQQYTLRLTSKALLNFNLKHGVEGNTPTIAVLGAVSDVSARIDLLSAALQHPENRNGIKDGAALLDLMADDAEWGREKINDLILQLAVECGLLDATEAGELLDAVVENNRKTIYTLQRLLVGKQPEDAAPESGTGEKAENPT